MESNEILPGQDRFITELRIENFKSIKKLELIDPKRINLFVGAPNTGKSNILEALSLFNESIYSDYIRKEHVLHLFRGKNSQNPIRLETQASSILIFEEYRNGFYYQRQDSARYKITDSSEPTINKLESKKVQLNDSGRSINGLALMSGNNIISTITYPYRFQPLTFPVSSYSFSSVLDSPTGGNFPIVLLSNDKLYYLIQNILGDSIELAPKQEKMEVELIATIDGKKVILPYQSLSDTFKVLVFYLSAIITNKNEVLLFEEPEAHSYPPYVSMLASEIAASTTNQFFIATHSPYLLNKLWNEAGADEVQIYLTDYENYQTVVRALPAEQVQRVLENDGDLFLNMHAFDKEN